MAIQKNKPKSLLKPHMKGTWKRPTNVKILIEKEGTKQVKGFKMEHLEKIPKSYLDISKP